VKCQIIFDNNKIIKVAIECVALVFDILRHERNIGLDRAPGFINNKKNSCPILNNMRPPKPADTFYATQYDFILRHVNKYKKNVFLANILLIWKNYYNK
jgi:hypothetical protein